MPVELDQLPPILTVEEAAAFLRLGRATAYRAARRGELPCIRIGKSLRVPRDRLLTLLEQGQAPITRRKPA
jgi:excisionase family DNA binding protein